MAHVSHRPEVEAVLNYLAPIAERPRTYTFEAPPGSPQTNVISEPHRVRIRDARQNGDSLGLDNLDVRP